MNRMLTGLAMAVALSQAVSGADNPTIKPGHTMKIRLSQYDSVL